MPSPYLWVVCISLASPVMTHSDEVHLIEKLNQFYRFDHNLFLIESTAILDKFVDVSGRWFVPQTLYVVGNITGDFETKPLRRSANTLILIGLTSTDIEGTSIFLKKIKDFQRVNIELKIGLFFTEPLPGDLDFILHLFEWCSQNSMIHIFIGYPSSLQSLDETAPEHSLNVYAFNPFGTFELINLTDKSVANYFPKICYNLRKHSIQIGAHDDLNTLIYSKDNPKFGGADGKLWQTIFYVVNASYFMVKFLDIQDGYSIQNMATNGTIDLALQATGITDSRPIYLYPIYMDKVLFVVPAAKPYAEFFSYLQTFFDDKLFAVSLLTVPLLIAVLTVVRYVKRKRIWLLQSTADVVNLFMYDNLAIDYRNLYRVETFIILPLTLTGFVIINVLLSILTSYLTRPMDQPEINTFDEIERSPFTVLVPDKNNMNTMIALLKRTWNIDWTHKMSYTTLDDFFQQILSFNTSICFVYYESKVTNLFKYQKRLNIRGFRLPTQSIHQNHFGYVVREDYPLKDCFNELIQWIMNAGLYGKWTDESYGEFVAKGFFTETRVNVVERGAEKYYVPIFIVYGWAGSVLVFVLEIVWFRLGCKMWKSLSLNSL